MFKKAGILFIYALTPIHPGSGTSAAAIDLPVQREKHTEYPMIQASGVKGALRDAAKRSGKSDGQISIVFGPEDASYGAAISFTDARILAFPVRSVSGIFGWITSAFVINRFRRDIMAASRALTNPVNISFKEIKEPGKSKAFCPSVDSNLKVDKNTVILEDLSFEIEEDNEVKNLTEFVSKHLFNDKEHIFWKDKIKKDLLVVNENTFRDFTKFSTEVITRIKIGETGTVGGEKGAGPWDEENLPAETILYSLVFARDAMDKEKATNDVKGANDVLEFVKSLPSFTQFGGEETVGRGLVITKTIDLEELKDAGSK